MIPRINLTKIFTFESAHQLPKYEGKCARIHGHSYKLEVTVEGVLHTQGSSEGMIMDASDLSSVVEREIISQWDHQFLNDVVSFRTTVENLSQEIFIRLTQAQLPVTKIKLWETEKLYATITPENI